MKILTIILCIIITSIIPAAKADASVLYDDEGTPYTDEIIIASPSDGYSTKAKKVSILGSANPNYPLYLNGTEIEMSEHGYFTAYVELEKGSNTFVFTSNGNSKTIVINKKTQSQGSSNSGAKLVKYSSPKYGIINKNNGSRRKEPDNSKVIITPLASGTQFNIIGKCGEYYLLSDNTYLVNDKITVYDGKLPDNKVTSVEFAKNPSSNTTILRFKMNVNALYRTIVSKNKITLTIYDTSYACNVNLPKNDIIKSVETSTNHSENYVQYIITLYKKDKVTGIDVTFSDGAMNFALKNAPVLDYRSSLKGATIILDAGHGGDDNGAVGPLGVYGPVEKNINLNITKAAEKYLLAYGANVILTRNDDTYVSLYDRVNFIKNTLPDISVSIHANSVDYSADYTKNRGFITYYSYNLYTSAPYSINTNICDRLDFSPYTPRYKNLALTRLINSPALLLETGFMSNPYDYEYLVSPEFQDKLGKAIADSVYDFLASIANYKYEPINTSLKRCVLHNSGHSALLAFYSKFKILGFDNLLKN